MEGATTSFWKQFLGAGSITNILARSDAALVSTSLTLLPIIIDAANVVNPRCNAVIWKHGFSFRVVNPDFCTWLISCLHGYASMASCLHPYPISQPFFFLLLKSSQVRQVAFEYSFKRRKIFQINYTLLYDIIYEGMNDVKAMVKDIKEEYKEDENSCLAAINLRYLFFF